MRQEKFEELFQALMFQQKQKAIFITFFEQKKNFFNKRKYVYKTLII